MHRESDDSEGDPPSPFFSPSDNNMKEKDETKNRFKNDLSESLRIRQLKDHLSKLRSDIYLTEVTIESLPRIKIEFCASYENLLSAEVHLPWILISPFPESQNSFTLSAWVGSILFKEEKFKSAEEVSSLLDSCIKSVACPGLNEYFLLENVDKLQIADFFLFYSEPSNNSPIYRSRQCHYFLFDAKDGSRCRPCEELHGRIKGGSQGHPDVKPEIHPDISDDEGDDVYAEYMFAQVEEDESSPDSLSLPPPPPPPRKKSKKQGLSCKHCDVSFKSEQMLKSHECNEVTETNDVPFNFFCADCTIQFRFGGTYIDHLFHIHRKDPNHSEVFSNEHLKIKCPYCDDQFEEPQDLERHRSSQHLSEGRAAQPVLLDMSSQHQDQYECFDCAKLFSNYRSYIRHRRRVHHSDVVLPGPDGSNNRLINKRCYFCPRHFTRRGKLARHLYEAHSDKDLSQIEEIQTHNPKELRICDICGKAVRNMSNHKENAHRGGDVLKACPICGKLVKKISYRGHLVTHKQKSWICSDCGQGFSHKTYLERHSRIHDPEYKCLPCKFCNKLFGRMDSLNKHLKSAHLGQRDYICSTCGKAFVCKSKLNRHSVVHLNQKNFPCEACSYQCSRLDNLNVHRLKAHGLEKTTSAAVKDRLRDVKLLTSSSDLAH